jgi:hypothetical protein
MMTVCSVRIVDDRPVYDSHVNEECVVSSARIAPIPHLDANCTKVRSMSVTILHGNPPSLSLSTFTTSKTSGTNCSHEFRESGSFGFSGLIA